MDIKRFKTNIPNLKVLLTKDDIIIISKDELECLSNAAIKGERLKSLSIVNHHVPLDFGHIDLLEVFNPIKRKFKLHKSMIGLLTAVEMEDAVMVNEKVNDVDYTIILTAGILNTSAPNIVNSPDINENIKSESSFYNPGTINIVLLINGLLTEHAIVNLFIIITEAKTLLFNKLNIRMKNGRLATGTSTDTIVVGFTNNGQLIEWSGYATEFGQSVGCSIYKLLELTLKEKVLDKK